MRYKIFASFAVIALIVSMVGCGEKNANVIETTTPTETTAPKISYSRDDYFNKLYGYYESEDSYISISEDNYQEKNKESGEVIKEGMLIDNSVSLEKDNAVSFEFTFYRASYPSIYWNMDSEGNVTTAHGVSLKRISQEEYESVETKKSEPSSTAETDDYGYEENEYVYTPPWYIETFDLYMMKADLHYIDNLLAVGKEDEALAAIEEKIFDKLDSKVSELINSREYWAAHNYVAMYNVYMGCTSNAVNVEYHFLENFFEEKYKSYDTIDATIPRSGRFSDFTQKYFLRIIEAKKADEDYLSKDECLYLLNDYFLQNGYQARTGLWDDYYMYFTDNFDQNFAPTEYYVVCPYTKQIRYLHVDYYFMDSDGFYEGILGKYL